MKASEMELSEIKSKHMVFQSKENNNIPFPNEETELINQSLKEKNEELRKEISYIKSVIREVYINRVKAVFDFRALKV
jgi:hypothetical protein